MKGFDLELIESVLSVTECPVIAHGGAGQISDILSVAKCGASGVAIASVLHYKKVTIEEIKRELQSINIEIRTQ